jgi:chromosome segregation ATPase
MLADAETLKQQMSNQVNDLMGLVGKAQAETSDIASKLKVKAHSDVKNKWKLAGAQFKDDKVKKTIAKLQAQAAINSNERDELKRKLIDEKYLNSEMRNEMIDTNATIDETKDTIEEMKETISQFQKEKKKHLLSIQQLTLQITQFLTQ